MSAFSGNAPTGSAPGSGQAVPGHARELAARLSALFETDSGIVARLNSAQRRLRHANDRLPSGVAPEAFGATCDGSGVAVPAALTEIHWQIHRAFCEYRSACEERRQLAVEVGELAAGLTDALCAAGFSQQDARRADVHQLARGAWPASSSPEGLAMSDYRDSIHCRIDPEQVWQPPDGGERVQELSVIMTDDPDLDHLRSRCWLPPAVCTLTPTQARELATMLLELAEQAERIGGRR